MDRYWRLAQIAGIVPVGVTATTVMSPSQAGYCVRTQAEEQGQVGNCNYHIYCRTSLSRHGLACEVIPAQVEGHEVRRLHKELRKGPCAMAWASMLGQHVPFTCLLHIMQRAHAHQMSTIVL
jgi:hypothetical protein